MQQENVPPVPGIDDVLAFLKIYERCQKVDARERTTYAGLFGTSSTSQGTAAKTEPAYTTVIGQLQRVCAYAAAIQGPLGEKTTPLSQRKRRPDLEILFARKRDGDEGLRPTTLADAL